MSPFTGLARLALPARTATTACALAEAATVEQIFNFSSYVSIENSIMRPNGHLLLSTLSSGNLYTIDPSAAVPQAEIVAALPGATALTGFAQIGEDKYAVLGGVRGSYRYDNETVYTVDFSADPGGAVGVAATLPDAVLLNGASSLPGDGGGAGAAILVADSRLACVWRVDVTGAGAGAHDRALEADYLAAPAGASPPIGVNGLEARAGRLWFTNTGTGVFGCVAFDATGGATAAAVGGGQPPPPLETVAALPAGSANLWDDFALLADDGEALACRASDVVHVSAAGVITTVAGGDAAGAGAGPAVLGCTSVTVTSGAGGRRLAYVTTKGNATSGLGGQIIRISF